MTKTIKKLLKLLERKAPDLFAEINPETVTEGQLLEQYTGGLLAEAKATIKWAECRAILREKLAESRLPALLVQRIERRFSDKIFSPRELTSAINKERQYLKSLKGDQP